MLKRSRIVQCCQELTARDMNHGSWKYGTVPQCFIKAREEMGIPGTDIGWLLAVESYVKLQAVRLVGKYHHLMPKDPKEDKDETS